MKMQRHQSAVTLRCMILLLCTLSVTAHARGSTNMIDEGLDTKHNFCRPVLINGEWMLTEPVLENMPSFPVIWKGTQQHVVCKLSAPTPSTISSPSTFESTPKIYLVGRESIFVADLQADLNFTSIPSTEDASAITYDSVEKKIYWTNQAEKRIYRADEDGGNREVVTFESNCEPHGIAIAASSRILYIAYRWQGNITSLDIGQGIAFPRKGAIYFTGLTAIPLSIKVDQEQGFLYWTMEGVNEIVRKPLNGSGSTETVYSNPALQLYDFIGFGIALSRDPRRLFFTDTYKYQTFYVDVNQPPAMAHELTEYMYDTDLSEGEQRGRPIAMSYFNGTLYWIWKFSTQYPGQYKLAVMTDYDRSNRSFHLTKNLEINRPHRMLIINVNP